jgi:hypothetical protein
VILNLLRGVIQRFAPGTLSKNQRKGYRRKEDSTGGKDGRDGVGVVSHTGHAAQSGHDNGYDILEHFLNEIIQFHSESFLEKAQFFQKSTPLVAARCPCGQRERLDFFKVKPL